MSYSITRIGCSIPGTCRTTIRWEQPKYSHTFVGSPVCIPDRINRHASAKLFDGPDILKSSTYTGEKNTQSLVPKARLPIWNGDKANFLQVFVAMPLPKSTTVRMPVERQKQRANRVPVLPFSRLWPFLFRQTHPCQCSLQFRLSVGLLRVRLLNFIALEEAIGIKGFSMPPS